MPYDPSLTAARLNKGLASGDILVMFPNQN
jgi:hypothetical protein